MGLHLKITVSLFYEMRKLPALTLQLAVLMAYRRTRKATFILHLPKGWRGVVVKLIG